MFQCGRRDGNVMASPSAEDVVLVADPQVEHAREDDDDLLVGVVRVRLLAGPAAGLDRREDHLEAGGHVRGQELVHGLEARVVDPAPGLAPDDAPARRLLGEELGDREVEGAGDPLDGRDRRAGHVPLDLREEALGDPGLGGDLAKRAAARLADARGCAIRAAGPSPSSPPASGARRRLKYRYSRLRLGDRRSADFVRDSQERRVDDTAPSPVPSVPPVAMLQGVLSARSSAPEDRR